MLYKKKKVLFYNIIENTKKKKGLVLCFLQFCFNMDDDVCKENATCMHALNDLIGTIGSIFKSEDASDS